MVNGVLLEIGLSPVNTFAAELVPLTPYLPNEFSNLIQALIAVGTFFEVLYGLDKMWNGSGLLGVIAFAVAFLGGTMVLYQDTILIGMALIMLAIPFTELSPANQLARR